MRGSSAMSLPRQPRFGGAPAAAALWTLQLLICGAMAASVGSSGNMSSPCYTAPSDPSCAAFQRSDADWTADLESLCAAMPYMIGCSLWKQCTSGEARKESPYCRLPSLLADVCDADEMHRMKGCEAFNGLCAPGTVVQQCLDPGVAPNVLTTFLAKGDVDGVCTSHSMDGCQDCSSVGKTNFAQCPEVLNVLSKLCVSMPEMPECANFSRFCSDAAIAADFPKVCTQNAADGSSTALPPMKMWMHWGNTDIFLFKEWVPTSTGQYVGICIGMCLLAVFTQGLKAIRLRVEIRWTALARAKCVCPEPACTAPSESDKAQADAESGSASSTAKLAEAPSSGDLPPCCAARAAEAAQAAAPAAPPAQPVPRSQRVPFWRRSRRGTLRLCGVDLIRRDQAVRNFWRACFTFVIMLLDYALMLVVMTFNIGVILAVCFGFALGALFFGHAGEPAAYPPRGGGKRPDIARDSSSDLEAAFVEGPGCCSGGVSSAHLANTA